MNHPPRQLPLRFVPAVVLCVAAVVFAHGLPGCAGTVTGMANGLEYPDQKKQSRSLDIQAVREGTILTITNTTAHSYPPCTMWINKWYSRPFPGLAVGETIEVPLAEFKDKFGETFRAGGFFALDRPTRVALVQLELAEEFLGLVVVGEQ